MSRALSHRVALSLLLGWAYPLWLALLATAGLAVAACAWSEQRAARRGAAGRGWFPLRAALVSCVLGALVFLAVFPAFAQVWLELSLGLVGGLFAALLLLARGGGRGVRALDFLLFHLCLTLLLAEFGLRLAGRVTGSQLLAQPGTGPWQFVLRQMLPPHTLWWGFPANSEGHYDEEFTPRAPGERVVATIGDSFSVGSVHHSLHFTTVAERSSGVRVDNYGALGIGPPEYLDMLSLWVAPRRPDLVVINLFVGNDLPDQRISGSRPWEWSGPPAGWPATWLERDNMLTLQVPLRILRIAESRPPRTFKRQPDVLIETREQLLAELPWVEDPSLEPPSFDEESFLAIERARVQALGIKADCDGLFELLLRMRAAAGQIPLAVMLIPDEFQVEDALWEELLARWPTLAAAERDRPQRLLAAFLAAEGIPALDLLPALRAVPPMPDGRRHLYHLHDTHFNARGNQVAGQALGEFLRTALGL